MHTRRLITLLLGMWWMTLIATAGASAIGTQVANSIAKSPPSAAARALLAIGSPMNERLFLFVPAETNRSLLEYSGRMELVLVFAITAILFFQNYSRVATLTAGILLLAVCASHFLLTPQVVAQGRILDFPGIEPMLAEKVRLTNLYRIFSVVGVIRLLLGAWLTGVLLFRGDNSRMRRRRGDVD